ncbi:hypothetical protein SAV14893_051860 [Streptomyces avermitilis]|uniref:Oxygenase n=1 Tax=Streptomyces avermitilis TaxID=33903 RepID=A0A4D4M1V2_STRAX|nr:hypothetical protein SAVMC3_64180 [Streptomyces avermitilis]GDY65793.1 hypothetical protein SAV14893_051860 [Streptomyces avermitilis]
MSTAAAPARQLDPDSVSELRQATEHIHAEFGTSATTPALLKRIATTANAFGDGLRHHCRPVDTDDGLFVLRGLDIDDAAAGPTPDSWATAGDSGAAHDITLLLLATVMGNPIAWEGQQDGRFVHNIVPSPGHETEQTGASSTVLLSPHTEDAFHPGRAHLLMLGCMRNHDDIATTAASVRKTRLSERDVRTLTRPVLPILPDDAYAEAQGYAEEPPPVPALFASEDGITLRFDPAYTPSTRRTTPTGARTGGSGKNWPVSPSRSASLPVRSWSSTTTWSSTAVFPSRPATTAPTGGSSAPPSAFPGAAPAP